MNPADVLLVIEIADTSLDIDRGVKFSAYAKAGISDYWIVNLIDRQVEVFRKPAGSQYVSCKIHSAVDDAEPSPMVLPIAALDVGKLFASERSLDRDRQGPRSCAFGEHAPQLPHAGYRRSGLS